ncbi:MAG: hypothetical protein U1F35_09530 [Steroidobacteraceae bacterium]
MQRGEAPLRDYPCARDGLQGMRFVAASVRSSQRGAVWESV